MVVPIFISSDYKEQKDKDPDFPDESVVDAEPADLPRDIRVRSAYQQRRPRRWSLWLMLCMCMLVLTIAVTSFAVGSYILRKYGGGHRNLGWCKVEYTVESFNRRASQQGALHGSAPFVPPHVTDEWIRLTEDSWEMESEGEFSYKIVTDIDSDTSALRIENFISNIPVCFIGSRYDFGLPSYSNIQSFLDSLHDKVEIMVDRVTEVTFLDVSEELPATTRLDASIERMCYGARRFSVNAISPSVDQEVGEIHRVEEMYYAAHSLMDAFNSARDLNQLMESLQRFQEIMAYVPSGDYVAEFPGGKVVSFEIRRPKYIQYQQPALQYQQIQA